MGNSLTAIQSFGQSIWYDNIRRGLITSGELQRMIDADGLRGITSNPSIFDKAISGSSDYNAMLANFESQQDMDAKALYEYLAIADIQDAADLMRPVYVETQRRDGYVSLEVSPYLASDTEGTIAEARRLWDAVSRRNVLIKVPATPAGIPAIEWLISEGIDVNVTLLFSVETYLQVADAYMTGVERLIANGGDPTTVASVASFFVSRIDSAVDSLLETRIQATSDLSERAKLESYMGRVAIANAKVAYSHYQEMVASPRWKALAMQGAHTQRLLWASTSAKNPAYRDVMYVEELIGPDTVNTVPQATFDAFRDHGVPRESLTEGVEVAKATLESLEQIGISLKDVTDRLLSDGVRLFAESFDSLLATVQRKRAAVLGDEMDRMTYSLPTAQNRKRECAVDLQAALDATLEDWRSNGKVRRLWAGDASLWSNTDEAKWLGWLSIAEDQLAHAEPFCRIAEDVKRAGFTHAVVLGMGGSSLFPEVLCKTFGEIAGFPELHILDSTDPAQILALESRLDLPHTLFIVSSKSGSTLEPNIFKAYFYARMQQVVGPEEAGRHFVAITDPGSALETAAKQDGFRQIYPGLPSIGGRYSALSNFGMAPAAIMGVDVPSFLDHAEEMVHSCAAFVPPSENPGVILGAIMGTLALLGRDKLTVVCSPGIGDFGAWLEQLLAESTGKEGKGLIPVDLEPLGPPEVYGSDRLFAYVRLDSEPDAAQDAAIAALEAAGQPVVRMSLRDRLELGEEVFRWEMATAVAGSILGINPFNQPDVEAAKIAARDLTDAYEKSGSFPAETPFFTEDGISLYADPRNQAELLAAVPEAQRTLTAFLRAHIDRLKAGDYFCTLAYVEMNEAHTRELQASRTRVRDTKRVATCLGFGPRFQHSTGQAYKGGPNTGVFLQITCDDPADLPVPGHKYTFGVVKAAQARGDLKVLSDRGRRLLRAHLGTSPAAGLRSLSVAVNAALPT